MIRRTRQFSHKKFFYLKKCLEDDAVTFDLFLKENDKNSVEAIKQAEAETKAKLERVASVKARNIFPNTLFNRLFKKFKISGKVDSN